MSKKKLIVYFALSLLIGVSSATLALAQTSKYVKARGMVSTSGVRPGDKFRVAVAVEIPKGFHINARKPREEFLIPTAVSFEAPAGIRIGAVKYPAAKLIKLEKVSETELAVYEDTAYISAEAEADGSIKPGTTSIKARLSVQACNDEMCFAPSNIDVDIPLQVVAATQAVNEANTDEINKAIASISEEESSEAAQGGLVEYKGNEPPNSIAATIASSGLVVTLLTIFVAGLLLNATPCVYPIIPITIGFFVNQGAAREGKPKLRRTFALALMYVLGMAVTYSLLGVAAAMSKGLFGAALQKPIVLINLAAVMIALSLSMFGVYEFRLPESLNRFATKSTQSTSGIIGALVMGLTMGIVAAPCIGPFVVGLLVFVGERGDPLLGFLMFFVLALGLGLPYLILGTFSGAINALPRSGLWMVTVRKVFGLVLIGMALYFLMPLMGNDATIIFVEFFALSAIYLLFFEAGRTKQKQFAWALRVIGVVAAAVAIWMAWPRKPEPTIVWQPYTEQAVIAARSEGKGVIIDAFADWCIPCKELDKWTFTDAAVRKEAERFVMLKLDLTKDDPNTDAGRAKQQFAIQGVPTVVFLDNAGRELKDLRLAGFESAADFLARMKKIESGAAGETLAQNLAPGNGAVSDAPTAAALPTGAQASAVQPEATPTAPAAEKDAASSAPVEAAPDAAATKPTVAMGKEINEPLPAASLNLLNGGAVDLASLRGKVVVLSFWATWCVPCIEEIPIFNQLARSYKSQGLELIAVAYPDEGADVVKSFLKRHRMNYTQALGSDADAAKFRVSDDRPDVLIIDRQGRIRFRHDKLTKKDVLEAEIAKLLGE